MDHWKDCQLKEIDHCRSAMRCALVADSGYFCYEYAYFGAYFFVSSHAERGVET